MFCSACGSQQPDGTAFCTNCGAALPAAAARTAGFTKSHLLILSAVVILIAGAAIAYAVWPSSPKLTEAQRVLLMGADRRATSVLSQAYSYAVNDAAFRAPHTEKGYHNSTQTARTVNRFTSAMGYRAQAGSSDRLNVVGVVTGDGDHNPTLTLTTRSANGHHCSITGPAPPLGNPIDSTARVHCQ
jgi:hypothetical protein